MPDEPKPRITLLYLRCCENERGKPLQHVWYDLNGVDNDGSPDVVKWACESNATDRVAELAERARKENKEHLEWEALEPFRKAYNGRLNYRQQQMLLCQIMQFVTRHKGDDET